MDWYRSKRAIVARLDGLVSLPRRRVSPDAVTLAAIPVAVGRLCPARIADRPAASLLVLARRPADPQPVDGALAR